MCASGVLCVFLRIFAIIITTIFIMIFLIIIVVIIITCSGGLKSDSLAEEVAMMVFTCVTLGL